MTHQDLRQPTSTAVRWKVAESKAGCISLNPANENYFATSHLNRDVRMWDVRMLRKLDSATSSHEEVYDKACTAVYEHGRACSSAYFDPSGRHLLSTAYDNYLRSEPLCFVVSDRELILARKSGMCTPTGCPRRISQNSRQTTVSRTTTKQVHTSPYSRRRGVPIQPSSRFSRSAI